MIKNNYGKAGVVGNSYDVIRNPAVVIFKFADKSENYKGGYN